MCGKMKNYLQDPGEDFGVSHNGSSNKKKKGRYICSTCPVNLFTIKSVGRKEELNVFHRRKFAKTGSSYISHNNASNRFDFLTKLEEKQNLPTTSREKLFLLKSKQAQN